MVWLEQKPAGAVKRRPHATKAYKGIPWPVCKYCGLVYLRNKPTKKAIRKGCWLYRDER